MNSFDRTDAAARDQAILDDRAQRLARPPTAETPTDTVGLLKFDLARERYAIETTFVRRIARLPRISPVPGVPDHFVGVINLNGEIVPIIDLRRLLGTSGGDSTESQRVIVLGRDRAELGIIVDATDEISTINIELLDKPASTHTDQAFVRTVLHDALVVLDGATLLNDSRLFIDQGVTQALSQETT